MALVTRCPNCGALYRVVADQLRLRNGMVRCGSCRQVFNGVSCLDYLQPQQEPSRPGTSRPAASAAAEPMPAPETPALRPSAPQPPATATRPANPPAPRASSPAAIESNGAARRSARAPLEAVARPVPESAPVEEGGLGALTVMGPISESAREPPSEAEFERLFAGVQSTRPPPPAAHPREREPDADDEPTFLRERDAAPSSATRIGLLAGCAILAPMLLLQLALLARTTLIVHFPQLQPVLAAICAPLSCKAQWPMHPELLAVISSDLQSVPGTDVFEFDALIRNRADFPMALPAIELTLTDTLNRPLARRIFTPEDYGAARADSAEAGAGNVAGGADLPVRLQFEVHGLRVAGFLAYPFYP